MFECEIARKSLYNGQLIQISRVSAILTYFFVRCGVVALKSYYLPRSPNFLYRNGQLIQISRVSAILTYWFVRCGVVALKSYYLPPSPSFFI